MMLGIVITTIVAGSPASAQPTGTVLNAASANAVPGSYVVRLRASADVHDTARQLAARYGGTVSHVYDTVLRGFALSTTPDRARRLAADSAVATVGSCVTFTAAAGRLGLCADANCGRASSTCPRTAAAAFPASPASGRATAPRRCAGATGAAAPAGPGATTPARSPRPTPHRPPARA
jgi:hypothetical protein